MRSSIAIRTLTAAALVALAIAGCKAPLGTSATDPAAIVQAVDLPNALTLQMRTAAPAGYAVQAAGPVLSTVADTWKTGDLYLRSPSVSTTFDADAHHFDLSATEAKPGLVDGWLGTVQAIDLTLPPLRPAADYVAAVFLRDAAGRLIASQVVDPAPLKAGANTIDVQIAENTESPAFLVSGATITWASTTTPLAVDVRTGVVANLAGVKRVKVTLKGACYGDGSQEVTLFDGTDTAAWANFIWNLEQSVNDYVPGSMHLGQSGTLTVTAYEVNGREVGKESLAIAIAAPENNVEFDCADLYEQFDIARSQNDIGRMMEIYFGDLNHNNIDDGLECQFAEE